MLVLLEYTQIHHLQSKSKSLVEQKKNVEKEKLYWKFLSEEHY